MHKPMKGPKKESKSCKCGCGETFIPTKGWQQFKNAAHRDAFHTALTHKARELVKSGVVTPDKV